MQAKRATEDLGKKLPGKGDITSAAKNAAPALPKVTPSMIVHHRMFCSAQSTRYEWFTIACPALCPMCLKSCQVTVHVLLRRYETCQEYGRELSARSPCIDWSKARTCRRHWRAIKLVRYLFELTGFALVLADWRQQRPARLRSGEGWPVQEQKPVSTSVLELITWAVWAMPLWCCQFTGRIGDTCQLLCTCLTAAVQCSAWARDAMTCPEKCMELAASVSQGCWSITNPQLCVGSWFCWAFNTSPIWTHHPCLWGWDEQRWRRSEDRSVKKSGRIQSFIKICCSMHLFYILI